MKQEIGQMNENLRTEIDELMQAVNEIKNFLIKPKYSASRN